MSVQVIMYNDLMRLFYPLGKLNTYTAYNESIKSI